MFSNFILQRSIFLWEKSWKDCNHRLPRQIFTVATLIVNSTWDWFQLHSVNTTAWEQTGCDFSVKICMLYRYALVINEQHYWCLGNELLKGPESEPKRPIWFDVIEVYIMETVMMIHFDFFFQCLFVCNMEKKLGIVRCNGYYENKNPLLDSILIFICCIIVSLVFSNQNGNPNPICYS